MLGRVLFSDSLRARCLRFFGVMLDVKLCRLARVVRSVLVMPVSGVRMMRGGLMVACLMVVGRLAMMTRCMLVVFGCLAMMLCSFL